LYQSDKNRLLEEAIVPGTTGFQTVARNVGKIQNRGLELQLFATPIHIGKFRWTIQANATYLKSTIKAIATSGGELLTSYNDISQLHISQVGAPLGSFYGVKCLGVNPTTGVLDYEDTNGDGEVTLEGDGQIIGKAFPDVFGGLNTTFYIGKFDLNIANQFSFGNDVYNYNRFYYNTLGWANEGWGENPETKKIEVNQIFANSIVDAKKRWQKPGDVTNVPRASLINNPYAFDNSSYFIEDGSYWRIRTLNLGYSIHPTNTKVFSSARFFVQVQNPFIFTKYSWFDPEVSSTGGGREKTAGIDLATYPHARTYSVGVNVIF
jgi:hypothetical protein